MNKKQCIKNLKNRHKNNLLRKKVFLLLTYSVYLANYQNLYKVKSELLKNNIIISPRTCYITSQQKDNST